MSSPLTTFWYLDGGWSLTPDFNYFLGSISFVLPSDMCLWHIGRGGGPWFLKRLRSQLVCFHCQTKERRETPKCGWACSVVPSGREHEPTGLHSLASLNLGWGGGTGSGRRPSITGLCPKREDMLSVGDREWKSLLTWSSCSGSYRKDVE